MVALKRYWSTRLRTRIVLSCLLAVVDGQELGPTAWPDRDTLPQSSADGESRVFAGFALSDHISAGSVLKSSPSLGVQAAGSPHNQASVEAPPSGSLDSPRQEHVSEKQALESKNAGQVEALMDTVTRSSASLQLRSGDITLQRRRLTEGVAGVMRQREGAQADEATADVDMGAAARKLSDSRFLEAKADGHRATLQDSTGSFAAQRQAADAPLRQPWKALESASNGTLMEQPPLRERATDLRQLEHSAEKMQPSGLDATNGNQQTEAVNNSLASSADQLASEENATGDSIDNQLWHLKLELAEARLEEMGLAACLALCLMFLCVMLLLYRRALQREDESRAYQRALIGQLKVERVRHFDQLERFVHGETASNPGSRMASRQASRQPSRKNSFSDLNEALIQK